MPLWSSETTVNDVEFILCLNLYILIVVQRCT